jgi:hypothetical protein
MNLFNEHGEDCTPLVPCTACEIVAWLKLKLSAEDFAELVERMNRIDQPKRARRRKLPAVEAVP